MVFNDAEKAALEKKLNSPNEIVMCPRCGAFLEYKEFPTAQLAKCQTPGCISAAIRGL